MDKYDFSLILCTMNRTVEVKEFLASLAAQEQKFAVQLIVVDQNPDDRLQDILDGFKEDFEIVHVRNTPGLSKARNTGLPFAEGKIIAFPDDDCTYPAELLKNIRRAFDDDPECGGISTLVTDREGNFSAGGRMYLKECLINTKNVWWCGVSPSIFVRKSSIGTLRFDETLGVGSGTIFGSGEETDFLLNLLENNVKLAYMPQFLVLHPRFTGPWKYQRGWLYGCGMGRVLRKHKRGIFTVFYYAALQQIRALQALVKFNFPRVLFHLAMSYGRICGFIKGNQQHANLKNSM